MNEANRVLDTINFNDFKAYSLYGGYGAKYDGNIVRFPTGSLEFEKRNGDGRVIHAQYRYLDNSVLSFKYVNETVRLSVS